ncbi:hypothetical protein N7492_006008 [Penicillium capsulatum]|uniref:Aminotransferase class V domain-containing protein n=1 Tax=Penicillium capsulatum TaxID=69766 RepID=A0A9W9IAP1_9EURO|nr:hypothetical protein N7492_006008 [Penicillium capsulatum]
MADARPDPYIRKQHSILLDEAREQVAQLIHASKDECVFVKNATSGVATVLYNLNFQPGEVVVYFEPVYGAVEKGIVSLQEHSSLQSRKVSFEYPISSKELERRFLDVVHRTRDEGLVVRAAVFDTIVSNPGVRFPFEGLVYICQEEGILSVIDGAHGIGQIPLDMGQLQPDFFVSNCHKWLYTPRSAAVLYVPRRNQHLIRTTLPTSWGFIPAPSSGPTMYSVLQDPHAAKTSTPFEELFEFVATSDDSAYICVPAALKFRRDVCGGEEAIMEYCRDLANQAADIVAAALGTEVLQEPDLKPGEISQMRQCAMTTVRLPIAVADDPATVKAPGKYIVVTPAEALLVSTQIQNELLGNYNTFVPVFQHGSWLWTRLSGQIFLDTNDFQWLACVLCDLCKHVARQSRASA